MEAKNIMIHGTASSVGKSIITAGLCRVFAQDGYKVAPFKSQNMALNSFITSEGKEMGRAQVVQAEAAGIEPSVEMNPILLKPTTDKKAQVIINGEVYKNMSAAEYHEFKPELAVMVGDVYRKLAAKNDIIVLEGAGSPAEINLRDNDIVNMGMAGIADAPVILVGDIDRGGVFASLAGTMLLLTEEERRRVKGVIINKFRGDIDILKPGLKMLEDIIHVPVLGVLPYTKLNIEDEDSLAERFQNIEEDEDSLAERFQNIENDNRDEIDIAVVKLPHMSNFTDFNVLEHIRGVRVRYIDQLNEIQQPDLIILPGTKNTIDDLVYIRENGIEAEIKKLNKKGTVVFGICGGFQMLGIEISDPWKTESELPDIKGMELLHSKTVFSRKKITTQVEGVITEGEGMLKGLKNMLINGYEIHMGKTDYLEGCIPFLTINKVLDENSLLTGGVRNAAGNVFGTYIHGIFDNLAFISGFIDNIRESRGSAKKEGCFKQNDGLEKLHEPKKFLEFKELKEQQYDKLADLIREYLDMEKIYRIIGL